MDMCQHKPKGNKSKLLKETLTYLLYMLTFPVKQT